MASADDASAVSSGWLPSDVSDVSRDAHPDDASEDSDAGMIDELNGMEDTDDLSFLDEIDCTNDGAEHHIGLLPQETPCKSVCGSAGDDVMELFSPPRLLAKSSDYQLRGDLSIDLATGWDMLVPAKREMVLSEIEHRNPYFIMCSPPCTMYSVMQHLWNKKKHTAAKWKARLRDANTLLSFTMSVCEIQLKKNAYFAFEHPAGAKSWQEKCVTKVRNRLAVAEANFHMCRFGLKSPVQNLPMEKVTRVISNLMPLIKNLHKCHCKCTGAHQVIQGSEGGIRRSTWASVYPPALCDAILSAIVEAQGS